MHRETISGRASTLLRTRDVVGNVDERESLLGDE